MATKLFLRTTQANRLGVSTRFDLLTAAGSSLTTGVVNTAGSGTNIQWTQTAGGALLEWISPPLAAGFTLATTDTMTFNIWALESSMNANAGGRARVYRWSRAGGISELAGSPWNDGAEFGTAVAVMNWTGTVSSNEVFNIGDRIIVRYFITNVGTMGGGFTCTLDYNGGTSGADGDSWFQLNNNVTFLSETYGEGLFKKRVGAGPPLSSAVISGHPVAPDYAWIMDTNCHADAIAPERRRGRHGRLRSSTAAESCDSMKALGNGLWFRSQRDRIEFPNCDALFPASVTSATFVLGTRRNITAPIPGGGYWFTGHAGTTDLRVVFVGSNTLTFTVGASSLDATLNDTDTDESIWAFTFGSRGMEVWRDGRKLSSNASTPTFTPGANALFLGDNSNGNDDVTVGLFYVYLRQLSPAEIQQVSRDPF